LTHFSENTLAATPEGAPRTYSTLGVAAGWVVAAVLGAAADVPGVMPAQSKCDLTKKGR